MRTIGNFEYIGFSVQKVKEYFLLCIKVRIFLGGHKNLKQSPTFLTLLKVRQIWNGFLKPTIPPKNKRTNSFFLPNSTMNEFIRLFFRGIRGYQKFLSKLTDLYIKSKQVEDCFKLLWPSQNIWTLLKSRLLSFSFFFQFIFLSPLHTSKNCKKRSNQETGLGNRGPLKVLNDAKLIIND